MFKVGDRVVCINANKIYGGGNVYTPKLVKGREYIIYGIHNCKCGSVSLDIGLSPMYEETLCICGVLELSKNILWCLSTRFRKVEEKKEYIAVTSNVEIEEPILN